MKKRIMRTVTIDVAISAIMIWFVMRPEINWLYWTKEILAFVIILSSIGAWTITSSMKKYIETPVGEIENPIKKQNFEILKSHVLENPATKSLKFYIYEFVSAFMIGVFLAAAGHPIIGFMFLVSGFRYMQTIPKFARRAAQEPVTIDNNSGE